MRYLRGKIAGIGVFIVITIAIMAFGGDLGMQVLLVVIALIALVIWLIMRQSK